MKRVAVRPAGFHGGLHGSTDIGARNQINDVDRACRECRAAVPEKRLRN